MKPLTGADVVVRDGIAWTVKLVPLHVHTRDIPGGENAPETDTTRTRGFAVYREDNAAFLSEVGPAYESVQNVQAAWVFDPAVALGDAEYMGAWEVNGGEVVGVDVRLLADMVPGIQSRARLLWSHDSSRALTVRLTAWDSYNNSYLPTGMEWKLKHTSGAHERRRAMSRVAVAAASGAEGFAKVLTDLERNEVDVDAVLVRLVPDADPVQSWMPAERVKQAEKANGRARSTREKIRESVGSVEGARATALAVFRGVCGYVDTERTGAARGRFASGTESQKQAAREDAAKKSALVGTGAQLKLRSLRLLASGVGIKLPAPPPLHARRVGEPADAPGLDPAAVKRIEDAAGTDAEGGAVPAPAAVEPEATPEPMPEPSVEEAAAGACAECGGTGTGDDGYACGACAGAAAVDPAEIAADAIQMSAVFASVERKRTPAAVDRTLATADAIREMAVALPAGPQQQRTEPTALTVQEEVGVLVLTTTERPTDAQLAELRDITGRRWDSRRRVNTFPAASRAALWSWVRRWYAGSMMVGPRGTQRVPMFDPDAVLPSGQEGGAS